ncbi:hypothetical protein AAZX31_04G106400 [Glycine max]
MRGCWTIRWSLVPQISSLADSLTLLWLHGVCYENPLAPLIRGLGLTL